MLFKIAVWFIMRNLKKEQLRYIHTVVAKKLKRECWKESGKDDKVHPESKPDKPRPDFPGFDHLR